MRGRSWAILLAVGVVAMLAVGCGGSDNDTVAETESTPPPTKAAFIKQGDALCEKSNDEIGAESKKFLESEGLKTGELPNQAQLKQIGEEIYIPQLEKRLEGLRELTPPAGDEKEFEAILVATEDGLAAVKESSESYFSNKSDPLAESKELILDYGFRVCGAI